MWPQLCTTFVCFYLLLLLKLSKQSSVRFFFLLLLATNSFIFCLLSYLQGQLFQGQIDFAEKLRIRSTKQKQKVCELLSVTTFPRIYQKSLVDTKEDLFCLLLQNMPTDFFIFRRLYFFTFAKSKCQNSAEGKIFFCSSRRNKKKLAANVVSFSCHCLRTFKLYFNYCATLHYTRRLSHHITNDAF